MHLRNLTLLVLLGLSSSALAADPMPSVVAQVSTKYANVDSIAADFTQSTKSAAFGEDKQSGTMQIKRPKKMKWLFAGPHSKEFVTDGKTMYVYTADENQVIKYDDFAASGSTADALLTSLDKLGDLFVVTELPAPAAGLHAVDLAPKKADGSVKKVHLELDKDLLVTQVVIYDAFDTVTTLGFTNMKLNSTIPDSAFTFVVPKGASIISAGSQ
jgi:outer membrane lipoprotein carrier protein